MPKAPEVTVIIPNYNGKRLLENCIRTLECQTMTDFTLLVVDNGSTDGSTQVTSSLPDFRMIALPENTGFCGAVNEGIRRTETPYVLLLNNDTEVEPDFVEALLTGIKRSERIFSCSAMMIDYRDRTGSTMPEIIIRRLAGRWHAAKENRAVRMSARVRSFPAAGARRSTAWMRSNGSDCLMSTILLIWRMWTSGIAPAFSAMKIVISHRQKSFMWGVRRQERAIMKRRCFFRRAIRFI